MNQNIPTEPESGCTRSHPHEEMNIECELRTKIARLRFALAPFASAAMQAQERSEILQRAGVGVMECDAAYKAKAIYHLCQKNFIDALTALEQVAK